MNTSSAVLEAFIASVIAEGPNSPHLADAQAASAELNRRLCNRSVVASSPSDRIAGTAVEGELGIPKQMEGPYSARQPCSSVGETSRRAPAWGSHLVVPGPCSGRPG